MSRTLSRWQALLLGLVVLAGVALGGWGLLEIGRAQWADTFEVTAGFVRLPGVVRGTPVTVNGVEVGYVDSVEAPHKRGGPYTARLRVRRQHHHLIAADATAEVVSDGLIGTRTVDITPGDAPETVADGAAIASREPADAGSLVREANLLVAQARRTVVAVDAKIDSVVADTQKLLSETRRMVESGKSAVQTVEARVDNVARETQSLLQESRQLVREGQRTVGETRSKVDTFLQEVHVFMKAGQETINAVRADADAVKSLPFVGGFVEDNLRTLVRPSQTRQRRVMADSTLFEPGRAILTQDGRAALNDVATWLKGDAKLKGSEIVVVTYCDPRTAEQTPELARRLSRERSEAVAANLREAHQVQSMGWFSWGRKMAVVGMGHAPPPEPEKEPLPPGRVEVVVFAPVN